MQADTGTLVIQSARQHCARHGAGDKAVAMWAQHTEATTAAMHLCVGPTQQDLSCSCSTPKLCSDAAQLQRACAGETAPPDWRGSCCAVMECAGRDQRHAQRPLCVPRGVQGAPRRQASRTQLLLGRSQHASLNG